MPNHYFKFKQFTVWQQKAAMKVCTDACLFGAWVAAKVADEKPPVKRVLDVGSGTGLLSLMLAQKADATIDAVEINTSAAEQAVENFNASPWHDRLHVFNTDVKHLSPATTYDLIISNPPFFENDLKSNNIERNYALHSNALTFDELLSAVTEHLTTEGNFAVLLPYHRHQELTEAALQYELFINESVLVKQSENHGYFRAMLWFSRKISQPASSEITIKEQEMYAPEFVKLLKDYYLHL